MFSKAKEMTEIESKKKNPLQSSIEFFGNVKKELKTISWTTKPELFRFTKVILASTFASGFLIYFTDLLIQKTIASITLLTRIIFG